MTMPKEFLTDLAKDLIKAKPMDRNKITLGYAAHMEAREAAIRQKCYDRLKLELIGPVFPRGIPEDDMTRLLSAARRAAGLEDLK